MNASERQKKIVQLELQCRTDELASRIRLVEGTCGGAVRSLVQLWRRELMRLRELQIRLHEGKNVTGQDLDQHGHRYEKSMFRKA